MRRVVCSNDSLAGAAPAAPRRLVARRRTSTTRHLILELVGLKILMTGDAVISADQVKEAPDGSVGVHLDEFPEASAVANSAGAA
jgi:hypothetical protein